ncbi:GNAT family N-acetyltransferase [Aeromicrobium stalagmiti]|uniref:GNAT family N-acetyltransferase n=1 Tax=Aeromicrobium stalagmiti TaxID=2738988 RepID=UPI00156A15E5|nr:GNAT family N-acetyltransferase [Aeromicrobium stalagmiti]NRQ48744.1 GNAT family N-acetyltransferase [Aeromicrobium stalagmiti]
MTSSASTTALWRVRALDPTGAISWTALVRSDLHPDGADVELAEADALDEIANDAVGFARLAPDGSVARVELTSRAVPLLPPLWFVEVPEPDASPPATSLVAFTGHGIESGSLLDPDAARAAPVRNADQLAALRWYPATGEVDQVYVHPGQRRHGIGTAIVLAAAIVTFPRGWARLWGDGQRTSDGEAMRSTSIWSHRAAPLTHLAPPMTPPAPSPPQDQEKM